MATAPALLLQRNPLVCGAAGVLLAAWSGTLSLALAAMAIAAGWWLRRHHRHLPFSLPCFLLAAGIVAGYLANQRQRIPGWSLDPACGGQPPRRAIVGGFGLSPAARNGQSPMAHGQADSRSGKRVESARHAAARCRTAPARFARPDRRQVPAAGSYPPIRGNGMSGRNSPPMGWPESSGKAVIARWFCSARRHGGIHWPGAPGAGWRWQGCWPPACPIRINGRLCSGFRWA